MSNEHFEVDLGVDFKVEDGWPRIDSKVYFTSRGVRYLTRPGVVLISKPETNLRGLGCYLEGYCGQFEEYLNDPDRLPDGESLIKFAGQLCYASFGAKRTWNKDVKRYMTNLKASGHGSVFEHANYSFLLYGVSRSLTHELIRHRAGFAYSQQSTRYVDQTVLRFVERLEFQSDPALHEQFIARIDEIYEKYCKLRDYLEVTNLEALQVEEGSNHAKTDRKKKINQLCRMILSHELEAPIVVTANIRAWRHFIEMRSHPSAELEIRNLAICLYLCLREVAPDIFDDYTLSRLPDGTFSLRTDFRKV